MNRFLAALEKSAREICQLRDQLKIENSLESASIIEAQLAFIGDPTILDDMEKAFQKMRRNAETVFDQVWRKYQMQFASLDDPFFRERFKDLEDLYRRVMRHLTGICAKNFQNIPPGSIVFAVDITPSDTAGVQQQAVAAFVTQKGGVTSHAAIVARAKGIPYVGNLNIGELSATLSGPVIVDGRAGVVILYPSKRTLEEYTAERDQLSYFLQSFTQQASYRAETYDGHPMRLSANLESVEELADVTNYGGEGVGLFRSEYLYLLKNRFPSEEEQFQAYRDILTGGLPVVIRVFDIGGDKHPMEHSCQELNPFLGCRAIRFLLRKPEILRTQIRAVLRAGVHGEVSLLFPLISSLQELREIKNIVFQVREELLCEGEKICDTMRLGSMIEVPSAALIADILALECDFLSIGTNDLVQYALAVDRSNETMRGLYSPTHPGVLRLLQYIITEAQSCNLPLSLCGEMAADPRLIPLLIGLGLHELSVSTRHIPVIKNVIRKTSILHARQIADCVLAMSQSTEVLDFLSSEYSRIVPEDPIFNFGVSKNRK